jgi:iron(III) transport system permease protein
MKNIQINRSVLIWLVFGLTGFAVLPWYALPDGLFSLPGWGALMGGHNTATGLAQVLFQQRAWLSVPAVMLALSGVIALFPATRRQGVIMLLLSSLGLVLLLGQGFAVTTSLATSPLASAVFGTDSQPGFGLGAGAMLMALMAMCGIGMARLGAFRGDVFVSVVIVGCISLLLGFVVYPVFQVLLSAFWNAQGEWSLTHAFTRIGNERIWGLACLRSQASCGVAWNTLVLAALTGLGATVLGTCMALIEHRSTSKWRHVLKVLAPLPIITPPFVVGLGLILLFGRAGIVNQFLEWALGISPGRWFYGFWGVWLAQLFAFTPIAYMIVRGVVQAISPSLEEASQSLGASRAKTFCYISLPLMGPGFANAFLVGFIESMADFGNPIVVGGQFAVLSTEIFFAIVGAQFDQGRAASLAWVLTLFALGIFMLQRGLLGNKSYVTVSGKGDAGVPMTLPSGVSRFVMWVAMPWLVFTLVVYVFAFAGGFVQTWGRDYSLTMTHFVTAFGVNFDHGIEWVGIAWPSLFTTVELSALAAPATAVLGLLMAWLLSRIKFYGRDAFEFMVMLTFAIPGTVLGVSYILAFNVPPFELTGGALIIVLCFVFRNLPVGVRAGAAAFKQLDKSLDEASLMLRASASKTLWYIVLPLLKPALTTALTYGFVRSMTTVSAVIFLVTAETELATTFIIGRVGQGDYGVALAYSTGLIVLMSVVAWCIQRFVGERKLGQRVAAHKPSTE